MTTTVLVGGATGTTGSRVLQDLRGRGVGVRPTSRSARDGFVQFDWYDESTWETASYEIEAMYLVAPIGDPEPAPVVRPFLERAVSGGLRRVVLLSSSLVEPGDSGLGALHRLVVDAVPEWAVLRPSWFMQNFVGDLPAAAGIRAGRVTTATGSGRVGFVDAGDVAAVAVELLLIAEPPQSDFILTGPETFSYAEICEMAGAIRGAPVEVDRVTPRELTARLADAGIPAAFAAVLASLDEAISQGAEDRVTDVVERVTGRAPRSMRSVLRQHLEGLR